MQPTTKLTANELIILCYIHVGYDLRKLPFAMREHQITKADSKFMDAGLAEDMSGVWNITEKGEQYLKQCLDTTDLSEDAGFLDVDGREIILEAIEGFGRISRSEDTLSYQIYMTSGTQLRVVGANTPAIGRDRLEAIKRWKAARRKTSCDKT